MHSLAMYADLQSGLPARCVGWETRLQKCSTVCTGARITKMDKFHRLYFRTSGFARRLVSGMKQSIQKLCFYTVTEAKKAQNIDAQKTVNVAPTLLWGQKIL